MLAGMETISALPRCTPVGDGIFEGTAISSMEAAMFTNARFLGSLRDI
jgi:hypothetical protein